MGGSLSNRQLVPSEGPLSGSATDGTDSELSGSSPSPRPFGPVGTEDPGKSKSESFWDSVGTVVFFLLSFYNKSPGHKLPRQMWSQPQPEVLGLTKCPSKVLSEDTGSGNAAIQMRIKFWTKKFSRSLNVLFSLFVFWYNNN